MVELQHPHLKDIRIDRPEKTVDAHKQAGWLVVGETGQEASSPGTDTGGDASTGEPQTEPQPDAGASAPELKSAKKK